MVHKTNNLKFFKTFFRSLILPYHDTSLGVYLVVPVVESETDLIEEIRLLNSHHFLVSRLTVINIKS